MKRLFVLLFVTSTILTMMLYPRRAPASGFPVVDVAAIAKLVQQIQQFQEMISTLNDQYKMLKHYAEIDHDGLASSKFIPFLQEFRSQFEKIMELVKSANDGSLLQQVKRLDEVYYNYHDEWEHQDNEGDYTFEIDPRYKKIKKQVLWTRKSLEHAATVGAEIQKQLPDSQEKLATLLDDTNQAQGLLLTAQIGNQIAGMTADALQKLQTTLLEQVQYQTTQSLEQNHARGWHMNRLREAYGDRGQLPPLTERVPLNPIN